MNRKHQLIPLLLSFVCPASSTPQKRLLSDKSSPLQPVSANTSTVTLSTLTTAQSNTQSLFFMDQVCRTIPPGLKTSQQ
jgi:hypothetical protein